MRVCNKNTQLQQSGNSKGGQFYEFGELKNDKCVCVQQCKHDVNELMKLNTISNFEIVFKQQKYKVIVLLQDLFIY